MELGWHGSEQNFGVLTVFSVETLFLEGAFYSLVITTYLVDCCFLV